MKYFSALMGTLGLLSVITSVQAIYYGNGSHGTNQLLKNADGQVKTMNGHHAEMMNGNGNNEFMYALGTAEIVENNGMDMDANGEMIESTNETANGMDMETDEEMVAIDTDQNGDLAYALEETETMQPVEKKVSRGLFGFGGRERRQARRAGRKGRRVGRRAKRSEGGYGVSPMEIDEFEDVTQP